MSVLWEVPLLATVECRNSIPWTMVQTRIPATLRVRAGPVNAEFSYNIKGVTPQA